MNLNSHINNVFEESIRLKTLVKDTLIPDIVLAGNMMSDCLRDKHKILCCGNGGSASDAQHFTAELVNRFLIERAPLPCITLNADTSVLTAIANDYSYREIFAKQIMALGEKADILLAISTSGNSPNIVQAIEAAHQKNLRVIALTGGDGGALAGILQKGSDLEMRVPASITPRIQEAHILILHCLCDLIESLLF